MARTGQNPSHNSGLAATIMSHEGGLPDSSEEGRQVKFRQSERLSHKVKHLVRSSPLCTQQKIDV